MINNRHRRTYRITVSVLFFLQGLCFASWASRIPSIQQQLHLSETQLGMVLFALPVGSLLALPFCGWLVNRWGSKKIALLTLLIYSIFLISLGFSFTILQLSISLVAFGAVGNTANIAINTQAVGVEARYPRNIMASFHGLWSVAGFTAAGIGTFMIGNAIAPSAHFLSIAAMIVIGVTLSFNYLLTDEPAQAGSQKIIAMPDNYLLQLGIIAFSCMMCEGAMFDWSGIFFQKVVHAPQNWVGTGYTAFMCTMATGRFFADRVVHQIGFKRTIQLSGLLITTGLLTAVIFPILPTAISGFFIVGFGVSSVVPLIYSEAGKSKKMSTGSALAAVSTIGFIGFLIGPPLIGLIAGAFNLRVSFLVIAAIGLSVVFLVQKIRPSETNS